MWAIVSRIRKIRGKKWVICTSAFVVMIIASTLESGKAPRETVNAATERKPTAAASESNSPENTAPLQTDAPDQGVPDAKAEFISKVDGSLTPELVIGNPMKYVGINVSWNCTILNVVNDGTAAANALCGSGKDIVLTGENVKNFDAHQNIDILGTVSEPQAGTNTYGGESKFPTIDVIYSFPPK